MGQSGIRYQTAESNCPVSPNRYHKESCRRAEYNAKNLVPTSLSIGIAKLKNSHRTLEENLDALIREADQALYRAKNQGRNRVVTEDDLDSVVDLAG